MSEDRNEEEDDEEYYFDEEDKETINTNTYIYKLPNLVTLLHIPVCRGQVFEDYKGKLYLKTPQMLNDYLDVGNITSDTKVIVNDVSKIYENLDMEDI